MSTQPSTGARLARNGRGSRSVSRSLAMTSISSSETVSCAASRLVPGGEARRRLLQLVASKSASGCPSRSWGRCRDRRRLILRRDSQTGAQCPAWRKTARDYAGRQTATACQIPRPTCTSTNPPPSSASVPMNGNGGAVPESPYRWSRRWNEAPPVTAMLVPAGRRWSGRWRETRTEPQRRGARPKNATFQPFQGLIAVATRYAARATRSPGTRGTRARETRTEGYESLAQRSRACRRPRLRQGVCRYCPLPRWATTDATLVPRGTPAPGSHAPR